MPVGNLKPQQEKNSTKTGLFWGKRMYKLGWKAIFMIWEGRNKQLHETKHIMDMEGGEILKNSIVAEYAKGLGRLPACDFSHMFRTPVDALLQKNLDVQKNWLQIVRQARILMDKDHLIHDEFTTSLALQKWIGISYGITDTEGQESLQEAIVMELDIGIGQLPTQFTTFFTLTKQQLEEYTIQQMKIWFQKVRQGRQQFDQDNCIQDEFSCPGAFRDWVGL